MAYPRLHRDYRNDGTKHTRPQTRSNDIIRIPARRGKNNDAAPRAVDRRNLFSRLLSLPPSPVSHRNDTAFYELFFTLTHYARSRFYDALSGEVSP